MSQAGQVAGAERRQKDGTPAGAQQSGMPRLDASLALLPWQTACWNAATFRRQSHDRSLRRRSGGTRRAAERPPQGPARPRSGLAGRWGSVPNRLTPQLEAISRSRTLGRRAGPRSRRSGRGLSDFRRERGGEAAVVRAAKLLLPRGDWGGYPDPLGRRSGRPRPWRCGLPCSGAAVSQPVRRAPPVSWLGSPA